MSRKSNLPSPISPKGPSLSVVHSPMSPPRVRTPKETVHPKPSHKLHITTHMAPQGVKERTGSGIDSFSPKGGLRGDAASISSFSSSIARSPLPSPRGGGGNSVHQQRGYHLASSPQSPKHPKPSKPQPRSTQRKRLTPSPGQTAMMMMNQVSSHSPKSGGRPSSASRAVNAPPTTSTDVINSYLTSSLSSIDSPQREKRVEDSQLKNQMTKYRELSQIERDIARRAAAEEELANEKKYSSTNERRSQGGEGGKGGERADKNPSNDPKLYEFWWEEDINAQSLTQADPGKVVDDFHLRRKGGRLVVEGEEGEEEKDSDDNDGSGKGQTRESMWLTSSELLLNHTKSLQAKREEMLPDLPEKKEEILKLNTLQWLTARGRGAKMGERMEQEKMLREWFEALDADGSGDISVDELEEPLISIGLVSSKEDLEEMIRKYDSSGDGEIDFQEFVKMVMTKEEGGKSNAMLKLFEDFHSGLLGNRLLPFSTLIHMYSRKQLFNAIMAKNPEEKAEGMQVLKARIKRTEARDLDLAQEKREEEEKILNKRASMKVQLKMQSTADLEKDVDMTLGKSSRFSQEEIRLRRDSMRRSSMTRRASITDSLLQGGQSA